jgi:hypothetical protein
MLMYLKGFLARVSSFAEEIRLASISVSKETKMVLKKLDYTKKQVDTTITALSRSIQDINAPKKTNGEFIDEEIKLDVSNVEADSFTIGSKSYDVSTLKYLAAYLSDKLSDTVKLSIKFISKNSSDSGKGGKKARIIVKDSTSETGRTEHITRVPSEFTIFLSGISDSGVRAFEMLQNIRKLVKNIIVFGQYVGLTDEEEELEAARDSYLQMLRYFHIKAKLYNDTSAQDNKIALNSFIQRTVNMPQLEEDAVDISLYGTLVVNECENPTGMFSSSMFGEYQGKRYKRIGLSNGKNIIVKKYSEYTDSIKIPLNRDYSYESTELLEAMRMLDTAVGIMLAVEDIQYLAPPEVGEISFNVKGLLDNMEVMVKELEKVRGSKSDDLYKLLKISRLDRMKNVARADRQAQEIVEQFNRSAEASNFAKLDVLLRSSERRSQ